MLDLSKALLMLLIMVVACTATTIATLPDKEMMGDLKEKCFDKCYEKCINCIVNYDMCGGEHHCDSLCERCGGTCKGEEYCPYRGDKYSPKFMDGICDKCRAKCHHVKCCCTFCDKYCYADATWKEHCPCCDELPQTCNTCMKTAEELKPNIYKPMMQDL